MPSAKLAGLRSQREMAFAIRLPCNTTRPAIHDGDGYDGTPKVFLQLYNYGWPCNVPIQSALHCSTIYVVH